MKIIATVTFLVMMLLFTKHKKDMPCNMPPPMEDMPCANGHSGMRFAPVSGIVSEIETTKDGFKFCLGTQKQVVDVRMKKPKWLVDGVCVEIDFNYQTITKK